MKEKPNYYAIIPANVRYDDDLKANEKLLYAEITALANVQGYCFATNNFFAKLYNTEIRTIQRWLSNLKEKGYIRIEIEYQEGTKNISKRKIFLTVEDDKNVTPPHDKNVTPPHDKNVTHNITSINTTSINKEKYKKETNMSLPNEFESTTFFENVDVNSAFVDFLKLREQLKAKNTQRAINLLIKKIYEYTSTEKDRIDIIEQSILNSWKGIFPIKQKNIQSRNQRQENKSNFGDQKVSFEDAALVEKIFEDLEK